jgi:uncharacterized protein YjaZ
LPFVVVHELAHALQRRAYREVTDPTLLSLSVYEGVADLLAFLATGERPHGPAFEYGLAHEAALWAEFRRVMARTGGRGWLYEGDRTRGRPADLGYFVGFRIAQTALARGVVTVPGLLDVRDPFALLAASGYDPAPDRDRFDPR